MKLAVVTNILTPYRIPFFESIGRRVDELTVLLMAEAEENREWTLPPVGFRTRVLRRFHLRGPGREVSLHVNYGVMGLLRTLDPDVVMSGGFTVANVAAFLYCKWFGKKYVGWGELTLRDGAGSSAIRRLIRRWLISRSDGCIASSSEAHDAFRHYGAGSRPILTSLMPVEVTRFHEQAMAFKRSPEYRALRSRYVHPILMAVGRLTDAKGYPELFAIYEQILETRPQVSLLLVGDGPDRPRYQRFVQEKRWSDVHFLGFVDSGELPKYLATADVFVFPTRSDTFGAVLSEAMSSELPVVSSVFAAATRDLIEDGVTGFRFDPSNTESSAATLLKILAMSPETRRWIGLAAYARVQHSDCAPSADVVVRFLESVLHKGRASESDRFERSALVKGGTRL